MNLHIAHGDQKLGPYSLAEAQGLLDAGTLLSSDLAWWKGQPGWIPLPQVPGIVVAEGAPASRPALVWVICGIYLTLILWGLSALLWLFFHLPKASSPDSLHVHINYLSLVVSPTLQLVKLVGVVLLFRLKRSALYVLGGVFGASFLFTAYQEGSFLLHASYSPLLIVQTAFVAAMDLIMLAYVWHLFLKRVLR